MNPQLTKVILYTAPDGYARFREESLTLELGSAQTRLSELLPSGGYQLRQSPIGFRSQFHCSDYTQWVFILSGKMEINVHGESRLFKAGEHFYSADLLPNGEVFDANIHGHWSRQVGDEALVTLFVRG